MNVSFASMFQPNIIDSRLKLHIVLLCHRHPQLWFGTTTLVERLRESPWAISEALDELAQHGLLQRTQSGEPRYRLAAEQHGPLGSLAAHFNDPLRRDQLDMLVQAAAQERIIQELTADERTLGKPQLRMVATF